VIRISWALTIAWLANAASSSPGVEALHPVPERHVRRGRLLCLERDDAPNGFDDVDRLAPEQQLPGERCPVELSGGEAHRGMLTVGPCSRSNQAPQQPPDDVGAGPAAGATAA